MRITHSAAALLLCVASACESSTGLEAPDLVGDWEIEFLGTPACATIDVGSEKIFFTVHDDGGSKDFVNVVTEWGFEPTLQYGWTVTGNMNTATRRVELNFWHTVLVTGSYLSAPIDGDGVVEGTLRDPKPGYNPHFTLGSCSYAVRGRRVGPATRPE